MAKVLFETALQKTNIDIEPKNGKDFKLEEMQELVGGDVEVIYLPNGDKFIVNEDGYNLGLGYNLEATAICLRWGVPLVHPIVGTAVYVEAGLFN